MVSKSVLSDSYSRYLDLYCLHLDDSRGFVVMVDYRCLEVVAGSWIHSYSCLFLHLILILLELESIYPCWLFLEPAARVPHALRARGGRLRLI